MYYFSQEQFAYDSTYEPEFLRHVSDDVTAHWVEDDRPDTKMPSKWEVIRARLTAFSLKRPAR